MYIPKVDWIYAIESSFLDFFSLFDNAAFSSSRSHEWSINNFADWKIVTYNFWL